VVPGLQSLGDPHLDDGLAGHPEAAGLPVECFDDPGREVDVDPSLLERRCGPSKPAAMRKNPLVPDLIEFSDLTRRGTVATCWDVA
jgi:hypothetical protein